MKQLLNPYDKDLNMCFGCSTTNPIGLKLSFVETESHVQANWIPSEPYMGYPNVLHGGIISALLDETGAWCVSVKAGTAGVTTEMHIKYLHPVYTTRGGIMVRAGVEEITGKSARVRSELFDSSSNLCAEAVIVFYLYPEEVAKKRFRYPGRDAFRQE